MQTGRSWFASSKRALLAPYGVGTIDQALLGIVAAKHFFVRQFGLAGKVVVLDEVHSYDLYTGVLITELVKRLIELSCTVIILSATLIEERRRELLSLSADQPLGAAYPMISGVSDSFIEQVCEPPLPKTVRIRSLDGALPVREALERARAGDCLLWIRNTVDDAQCTYRQLRDEDRAGGPELALLHSRFPFFRREELETDWMERLGPSSARRPAGCILVTTQVAEQSVDIDADLLITDLAPTDMLLQRLGRLWRHKRSLRSCPQPEIWIQMPPAAGAFLRAASRHELLACLGRSARVYAPYVLLRSMEQWRGRNGITLPDDIRGILEATYARPPDDEPAAWRELRCELESRKNELAQLARSATAVWSMPVLPDDEAIHTRYSTYRAAQLLLVRDAVNVDDRSERISLLSGETITVHARRWDFSAAKALHRNLIRVPKWAVEAGLKRILPGLRNHITQPTAMGLLRPDGTVLWPGAAEPAGLAYDANQGILIEKTGARLMEKEIDESYD
jgi:CRISPR-associated endonuclease/helicase Cas3